jgi:hypothetical protein
MYLRILFILTLFISSSCKHNIPLDASNDYCHCVKEKLKTCQDSVKVYGVCDSFLASKYKIFRDFYSKDLDSLVFRHSAIFHAKVDIYSILNCCEEIGACDTKVDSYFLATYPLKLSK